MLMLQGYADDSGSDGQRIPYVLGGWVLSAPQWASFSDDWKTQLERAPVIEYFKMTEASQRVGQFLGMDRIIIDRKVRDLAEVVVAYKPVGISSVLSWNVFRTVLQPFVDQKSKNPYPYLFLAIFEALERYQREEGIFPEKTDFGFDEQGASGHFAQEIYPYFKYQCSSEQQKMLGRLPMMLDDKEILPLQAADMLAWTLRCSFDENSDGRDRWRWLIEMLGPLMRNGVHLSSSSFRTLLEYREQLRKE